MYDGQGTFVTVVNKANNNEQRMVINSLGEGGIWVCNKNGNLLIGDSNSEVSLTDGGIKIGNLNGLILGEVFIVNGEININERIASEGYLAHKWNLSAELPSNHNYKSNAP